MNNLTTNQKLCLAEFTKAAVHDLRAPRMEDFRRRGFGDLRQYTHELVAMGFITIEVYGQNWRVVTINKGPHARKRTLGRPKGGFPYLRLDKDGWHDLEDGESIV